VLPNLSQPAQEQIAAPVPAVTSSEAPVTQEQLTEPENQIEPDSDNLSDLREFESNETTLTSVTSLNDQSESFADPEEKKSLASSVENSQLPEALDPERVVLEGFLLASLSSSPLAGFTSGTLPAVSRTKEDHLELVTDSGLALNISYDLNLDQPVKATWITIASGGVDLSGAPKTWYSMLESRSDGVSTLSLVATDMLLGDLNGDFGFITTDKSQFASGILQATIQFSEFGSVLSSSLNFTPRT